MPRIFDNIEKSLLPALRETLSISRRADFCVGYFNLRGWKQIDDYIEGWSPEQGECCRLLVGMQNPPRDDLRLGLGITDSLAPIDNNTAVRFRKKMAEEFRDQLTVGVPTAADEVGLRRLAAQIRARKVQVKLYLRHRLHAKLYLMAMPHPHDPTLPHPSNPYTAYLGSSNLTFAGLSEQGELNVDVTDPDAGEKLARWFETRWNDRLSLDVSDELATIIEESWARTDLIPPYYIYVKMAYHLSQEARAGLAQFSIPRQFDDILFDFQNAAVKIAAHHVNKRGGVLIGDVVGLGKTLMATALAAIIENANNWSTLIICPANLVKMWRSYVDAFGLRGRVLSIGEVTPEVFEEIPGRFRLTLIDESHNLRNREGKRYKALQEYIRQTDSRVIMLSATPYNKTYLDLSSQLRLFIPEDKDLGIRPEHLLREIGEARFAMQHQAPVRSLAAFEKSEYADDWRELMRLYLVRRTRSFIQANYAETDPETGRKYLTFASGRRSYFPDRIPKTVKFRIDDEDPGDQYARLYAPAVVDAINSLNLPRYGLGNYVSGKPEKKPTAAEEKMLGDLSRAGKRLMGFSRTNLFKRMESSGEVFVQSIERHIVRNCIYLHAIENGLPLPIGTQDAELLDTRFSDEDADALTAISDLFEYEEAAPDASGNGNGEVEGTRVTDILDMGTLTSSTGRELKQRAAHIYNEYATRYSDKFKWLPSYLFTSSLQRDLQTDADTLLSIRQMSGTWNPDNDAKLEALLNLLKRKHPNDKVLVFTQFADTVAYLKWELAARGVTRMEGATGRASDPTALAWRFSPESNGKRALIKPDDELRVLVATDVLSEGQNLQDCSIVVNYDLPWAIIRLIQRVGRVDRIGQELENIHCYSFMPVAGVERVIRLRERVRHRLRQNAEVVGTDEAFFEDDMKHQTMLDLYNEKAGILDGDADGEVDLASYAYQIWKNAITEDPKLKKIIPELPNVIHATKGHIPNKEAPEGALVYMRTPDGTDALAWIGEDGKPVTESQLTILKFAECQPDTPALERLENHYELVEQGMKLIIEEERSIGGGLGRPSGARFRVYNRLMAYAEAVRGTLFDKEDMRKAIDEIYKYPLRQSAIDILNRRLREHISDEELVDLVISLRNDDRLCIISEDEQTQEPQIICSMGLSNK